MGIDVVRDCSIALVNDYGEYVVAHQSIRSQVCAVCQKEIRPFWYFTFRSYWNPKVRLPETRIVCTDCIPLHVESRVPQRTTGSMRPVQRNTEPIRKREIMEAATMRLGAVVRNSTPRPTWMQRVQRRLKKVMLWRIEL